MEEQAEALADGMAAPRGFSLTLPERLSGEYELTVLADGVRYDAGTITLVDK